MTLRDDQFRQLVDGIAGMRARAQALGGTLTLPVTNGVADFNDLTLDKPGTGYTLQATSATAGMSSAGR